MTAFDAIPGQNSHSHRRFDSYYQLERVPATPAAMVPRALLLLCCLPGFAAAPLRRAAPQRATLAAVAALLGAAATTVDASPCVNGLDWLDLISGGYGLHSNATNPRECCAACGEQPGCQHFSWVQAHQAVGPILGLSAPPGCWLKLDAVVWTRRMNTPTSGNRGPPAAASAPTSGSSSAAPSRTGASPPAIGYEAFYVVVGGDCRDADACNATLGACDEPEVNSTRSACGHCLGGSIHAPTGGSKGDCPESGDLLHGQSCNVACPDGMYPSGQHPTCHTGAILGQKGGAYDITCEPCAQCEGIHVRTSLAASTLHTSALNSSAHCICVCVRALAATAGWHDGRLPARRDAAMESGLHSEVQLGLHRCEYLTPPVLHVRRFWGASAVSALCAV
jgi:hypothetical protein